MNLKGLIMNKNKVYEFIKTETKSFRVPLIILSLLSLILSMTGVLFAYFSKEVIDQALLLLLLSYLFKYYLLK